jgi:hypothetical protein
VEEEVDGKDFGRRSAPPKAEVVSTFRPHETKDSRRVPRTVSPPLAD